METKSRPVESGVRIGRGHGGDGCDRDTSVVMGQPVDAGMCLHSDKMTWYYTHTHTVPMSTFCLREQTIVLGGVTLRGRG